MKAGCGRNPPHQTADRALCLGKKSTKWRRRAEWAPMLNRKITIYRDAVTSIDGGWRASF
ncbi:Uncharacterised protein [Vibrio cholerae]|nr:Uncharacterised protein [Vibrio cholerae]